MNERERVPDFIELFYRKRLAHGHKQMNKVI